MSTGTLRSMRTVGEQNTPPQTVPLGHEDSLELEANENQQKGKDAFLELPYQCKSKHFWKMGTAISPLSQGSWKSAQRRTCTNKPCSISLPHTFAFAQFAAL